MNHPQIKIELSSSSKKNKKYEGQKILEQDLKLIKIHILSKNENQLFLCIILIMFLLDAIKPNTVKPQSNYYNFPEIMKKAKSLIKC